MPSHSPLQLQLNSAPLVHVYPATEGPHAKHAINPLKYDFSKYDARSLAQSSAHYYLVASMPGPSLNNCPCTPQSRFPTLPL